jgi:hypothetical protein
VGGCVHAYCRPVIHNHIETVCMTRQGHNIDDIRGGAQTTYDSLLSEVNENDVMQMNRKLRGDNTII